jgi:hypothetical protein
MTRPNKVSEIRSIGSSTRTKGIPETADIKSKRALAQTQRPIFPTTLFNGVTVTALCAVGAGSTVCSVETRLETWRRSASSDDA